MKLKEKITINISKYSETPGLRKTGKRLQKEIKDNLKKYKMIYLDFKEVKSVSSCFSDEAFAKHVKEIGRKKYFSRIKFCNLNDFSNIVVLNSILDRLKK